MTLVTHPNPCLRTPCASVLQVGDDELRLLQDMKMAMFAEEGAGIAAPQVGSSLAIFLIDGRVSCGDPVADPKVFINPQILRMSPQKSVADEGCLSFPGITLPIKRHVWVDVGAFDDKMRPFEVRGEGFFARALQHEMDHLQGRLFIDLLPSWKTARGRNLLSAASRRR